MSLGLKNNPASNFQAVLFDLDDTLYPEHEYVLSGFAAVGEFLSLKYRTGLSSGEILQIEVKLLADGRDNLFDRLLEKMGIFSPALVATLVHVYRSHRPNLSFFSDVVPAFKALRKAGVHLGVITDGKATVQRNKMEALGLFNLVDVVICTDDLLAGCVKPSTIPFEIALNYLRVPPAAAIYVADDLSKDFIGPRHLGMGTLRIDRGLPFPLQPKTDFPENYKADATCRDLDEVLTYLLTRR